MISIAKICRAVLWRFVKKTFSFWQRLGFNITPNHYCYPIPDTRFLKDKLWQKQSGLLGIDMDEQEQMSLLLQFSSFKSEYENLPRQKTEIAYQYYLNNGSFESVDAEILYCMVRHFKPKRFFEIGSANSTYLAAQAILKNKEFGDSECELTVCDPYPNEIIKRGFPGFFRLIPTTIQDIPISEFSRLERNDILFIDSSHVLCIGSDVQYELLEVLPAVKKGVIIHIHDIFLPAEYPKEWVMKDHQFFNEQYFLQAFLAFNDNFRILWAGSFMHLNHPDRLEQAFRSYERGTTWPGSFWIQRIK